MIVLSCLVLPCLVLHCGVLPCLVLFWVVLSCLVLCGVLSCLVLPSRLALSCHGLSIFETMEKTMVLRRMR